MVGGAAGVGVVVDDDERGAGDGAGVEPEALGDGADEGGFAGTQGTLKQKDVTGAKQGP